ncbi:hypothetical protein GLA29479_5102 [Lysobacter antibioticus]|uniref:hypothetical protein n=1 Tax=Lysobacter antibioticus TaxID=84531 RepID=UPI0007171B09|nr:hypothetical protein [Lysobacter antibioticus]ALN65927.1 hypothetical protein GLA29479_5102 [Lysobacter antibioticus]
MTDPTRPVAPPPIFPLPTTGSSYDAAVLAEADRIVSTHQYCGRTDVEGMAYAVADYARQHPDQGQQLQDAIGSRLLPMDQIALTNAVQTVQRLDQAKPIGTQHGVAVDVAPGDSERSVLDKGYRQMAADAGLSPQAVAEFARRAPALDDGTLHAPSGDPQKQGPAIDLSAARDGKIELAPTSAQSGLLKLLAAQDRSGLDPSAPTGAAAGIPFMPDGSRAGAPGNGAVTPEIAAEMLRNISEGKPPFRPDLGKVGPVSWFVTEGNPHVGVGNDKSVVVPVEVANTSGKPPLQFGERELLEIYDRKYAAAAEAVEQQVREKAGKGPDEPLSKRNQNTIERSASKMAERQMWTEVGEAVAKSESGVGKVSLQDSMFSRSANGEFTLTSRPENVRVQGGAQGLLDVIKNHGVKADPEVLKSANDLAAREGWAGKVEGAFRVGGRVLIVVGVAADAYRIYTAEDKVKTVVEVAGGWAGAAAAGGAFATVAAPVNTTGPWGWAAYGVGTLATGAFGYMAGSEITKTIYELVVEGKPIEVGG